MQQAQGRRNFTDESTTQLECHRRKCFRKEEMPIKLKYKHKHPLKAHGVGRNFQTKATQLVIFTSIVNTTKYGDILSASLLPFKENFPNSHIIHTSRQ